MIETNDLIAIIAVIVAILLVVLIISRYTFLVRKAMIEKGIYIEHRNNKFKYLDLGCIVFGLGIGLLISSIFTGMDLLEDTMDLLVWGTILVFGAAGLILAHFIRTRLEK